MNDGRLLLFVLGILIGLALLLCDARRRQHELIHMERMRGSALYRELYAAVLYAREHQLDCARIERSRVVFYGLCPPGVIGEFVLSDRGYRPLSPTRTRALAMVLAEDIPELRAGAHYRLRRYAIYRPNGTRDWGYMYVIRTYYKTALMYERRYARID